MHTHTQTHIYQQIDTYIDTYTQTQQYFPKSTIHGSELMWSIKEGGCFIEFPKIQKRYGTFNFDYVKSRSK